MIDQVVPISVSAGFHLLLVEDNPADATLLRELVADAALRPIAWTVVERLSQAIERLGQDQFDAVLLDLSLPDSQGLHTFVQLRNQAAGTPVVVLSALSDHNVARQAIREGAQDYLVKGLANGEVVFRSLEYAIERRRLEEALARKNRTLRILTQCNQALVRATDETALLHSVCELIVETGGYRMAWVGFARDDASKSVIPVAYAGVEAGYLETLRVSWDDNAPGHGPTGSAIRTGQPRVVQDTAALPSSVVWREAALGRGYAASIALPLLSGSRAFGALNVYADDRGVFDAEAVDLLLELAADLAYGLNALRLKVEHTRSEAALRASEEHFRSLIENASDVITVVDAHGIIQYESPSLQRVLGYEPADVIGLEIFDFLHPDDLTKVRELYTDAIQKPGTSAAAEFRYKHQDGSWRVMEAVGQRILNEQGQPAAVINSRDVTGRQVAHDQLRLQAALLANVNDAIVAADAQYRLTAWNQAATALYGWTADEVLGQNGLELLRTQWPAREAEAMRRTIAELGRWRGEATQQRKDGTRIPVEVSSVVLRDKDGQICGYVSANRDITERKRAEEALRRSEEHFRSLIENASDIITVLDAGGNIRYESPAVERVLGFQPEALVGRNVLELVHPEDVPAMLEAFARALPAPGDRASAEVRIQHKDGTWRTLEAIGKTVVDEQGQLGGIINSRDITERKQAEAKTQAHLAELEGVNRISTALRMAETLDEMLPALLDETLRLLGTDAGTMWLRDETRHELRQVVARGWFQGTAGTPFSLSVHSGLGAQVFASGQPYVSREFATDPHTRDAVRPLIPAGWGGAVVPIRSTQQFLGVLHVAVQLPREIQAHEVRLLSTLSEIAGNALKRTALHQQTVRRLQQLSALNQIDRAISSIVDLRLTLSIVLDQVASQLGVDAADVLIFKPGSQTLECASGRGFHTRYFEKTPFRLGDTPSGLAVLERRMIHGQQPANCSEHSHWAEAVATEGFSTYYGVPLIAKGQIMGVLEVFQRTPLEPDEEWLAFLNALAGQAAIAIDNATLFDNLQRSNAELSHAYDATIEGWSRALDLRDKETEGHTQRVAAMTVQLAEAMGLPPQDIVHMRRGALLHDIGKMGVPDRILLKPGPLTDEEWTVMHRHPAQAYELLWPITYLQPALDIPYCHHEKWDGTGYPRGLRGEQIPLAARIFALVDVWDALRSDRPYRSAWPEAKVREYIQSLAGTHFEPCIVEAFLRLELGGSLGRCPSCTNPSRAHRR